VVPETSTVLFRAPTFTISVRLTTGAAAAANALSSAIAAASAARSAVSVAT
jgi:hypothetical protein